MQSDKVLLKLYICQGFPQYPALLLHQCLLAHHIKPAGLQEKGCFSYLYPKCVYEDKLVDLRFYTSKHSPGSSETDTGGPYINKVHSNATRAPLEQKTETKK